MPCVKLALSSIVAVVFAINLLINLILSNGRQTVDCSQRNANEESVDNHLRYRHVFCSRLSSLAADLCLGLSCAMIYSITFSVRPAVACCAPVWCTAIRVKRFS